MNKNLLKSIVVSAMSIASLFFVIAPTAQAATTSTGSQSGPALIFPLSFTRTAPEMKSGVTCSSNEVTPVCKDVTSGIGMYYYSGTGHFPERQNIGNNQQLTVVNNSTGATTYTGNFRIDRDGTFSNQAVVRVYGLPKGNLSISFSYVDAKSSDIQSVISQTKYYCDKYPLGGMTVQGGPVSGKEKGYDIARTLVDGCKRYNKEPFLPGSQVMMANGGQPFMFNPGSMTDTRVAAATGTAPVPDIKPTDTGKDPQEDTCPLGADAPLRWIGCPLIETGGSTADALQQQISDFLYTPTEQIFGNSGFKSIANTFRNLGIALIIIAGLVMVISQASGLDFVDAYTVRKLLPRMIVALIGVALALPLLQIIITFFNDIGVWMNDLIMSAVHTGASGSTTGTGTDLLQITTVLLVGGGAGLALGLGGILSLLGTIILALLVGFLVLALRQLIILVCVLLAPLAIAAYVLPGTQKLWEFWKNAFVTAMTIFPIIMLFIASGKALSTILGGVGSKTSSLLAILVYFAPFFLLPFAFKLAGGLMSTVFSIANDRGRGGFDRLKKYRQGKVAGNFGAMKAGNRFSDRNALSRTFNRGTSGITAAANAGVTSGYGLTKRGRQQVREGVAQQRMIAATGEVMKSPAWSTIQEDDDALRAATYNSAAEAQRELAQIKGWDPERARRAAAAAQQSIGYGRSQAIAAAQQLATTGTGYTDIDDQATVIARASGGNLSTASSIAGYNNFISKQKGRHDLAPGAGALINAAHSKLGKATSDSTQVLTTKAWNSGSLYSLANGKGPALKTFRDHWTSQYEQALASGDEGKLKESLTAMQEMRAMLPNASGDNQITINQTLARFQELEDAHTANFVGGDVAGPRSQEQIKYEQAKQAAAREARTYERYDPNLTQGPGGAFTPGP